MMSKSSGDRYSAKSLALGGSHSGQSCSEPFLETLLWIGDHQSPSFRSVYDFCSIYSFQVATRSSLQDARLRPVRSADAVVLCRGDRHPVEVDLASEVMSQAPLAIWWDLLGPLSLGVRSASCSGARRVPYYGLAEELRFHWPSSPRLSQSRHVDPEFTRSLVVLAASAVDAEYYLDMASDAGLTVFWARYREASRFRNVGCYWWDDSVATAVSSPLWRERVHRVDPDGRASHRWICHSVSEAQEQDALAAGISSVVRKPFRADSLLAPMGCGINDYSRRGAQAA
ncbi:hypothetical protein OAL43_01515 [bacterium]|nr:hypothetical protein [bacterium]